MLLHICATKSDPSVTNICLINCLTIHVQSCETTYTYKWLPNWVRFLFQVVCIECLFRYTSIIIERINLCWFDNKHPLNSTIWRGQHSRHVVSNKSSFLLWNILNVRRLTLLYSIDKQELWAVEVWHQFRDWSVIKAGRGGEYFLPWDRRPWNLFKDVMEPKALKIISQYFYF